MERGEGVKKNEAIDYENLNQLLQQVKSIGIREDVSDYLADRIKSGIASFNLKAYESIEENSDKLGISLYFFKLDDGKYMFPNYSASLYHPMEIEHLEIAGIDTKELDKKMREFDWYHDLEEKEDNWINSVQEAYDIEDSLRTLSRHPEGGLIAAKLWNNHVPLTVMEKPGFLSKIEYQLKLYPNRTFVATTPLKEAYDKLKIYQEIDRSISKCDIDDLKHHETRSVIIHKLLKDEQYQVSMPVSPLLTEVIQRYHVIEVSHTGHRVFEQGHETTTLAIKQTLPEAIKVLKSETDEAKINRTRRRSDFAIFGEEKGKTLRLSSEARPIEDSAVLVAVAKNSLGNGENAFKIKMINDPSTSRHHEELFIRYDPVSHEIKFFNKDGIEYIHNQAKYFEKAAYSKEKDILLLKNRNNNERGNKKLSV